MLVVDLGKWMNKTLINWGIDPAVADRFDETIMALLMIVVAIVLNYLCQAILIGGMKQYTRRKPHQWNTLLMKRRVFHNLIHTIPAFLVYSLLPMACYPWKRAVADFPEGVRHLYYFLFTIGYKWDSVDDNGYL